MARTSSEERLAQAGECLASGMTVKDWCLANGVPASTMYPWVRRLREERPGGLAPAFVEVVPAGGRPAAAAAPVVARVGAVEILLPPGFAEADAAAAMRAAASL